MIKKVGIPRSERLVIIICGVHMAEGIKM